MVQLWNIVYKILYTAYISTRNVRIFLFKHKMYRCILERVSYERLTINQRFEIIIQKLIVDSAARVNWVYIPSSSFYVEIH